MKQYYKIEMVEKIPFDKVNHKYLYTYNVYRVYLGCFFVPKFVISSENAENAYGSCRKWIEERNGILIK